MISLPDDITVADMAQWLDGGWFFFKKGDTFVPGYMEAYPNSSPRFSVRLPGDEIVVAADKSLIKPHWPVCGCVNLPDRRVAIYIERQQKKQFCRTYNHRMVRMSTPGKTIVGGHLTDHLHPSSEVVVQALFNPEYYSLSNILEQRFVDGWASCAVSPTVIVLKQRPRNLIFYRGEVAGYLAGRQLEDVDATMVPKLLKHFNGEAHI